MQTRLVSSQQSLIPLEIVPARCCYEGSEGPLVATGASTDCSQYTGPTTVYYAARKKNVKPRGKTAPRDEFDKFQCSTLIFDLWGSREREKASLYAECRTDVARMGRPAPLWGALSSLLSNERTNDLILAPVKPYALVLHADSRPAPCLTPNPSLIPGPARRGGGALPAARVPPF